MAIKKFDLNKCTAAELCSTVPGLTSTSANRIIAARRRQQRFKSVDDVLQVRGITQDIFETLRQHVKVTGKGTEGNNMYAYLFNCSNMSKITFAKFLEKC